MIDSFNEGACQCSREGPARASAYFSRNFFDSGWGVSGEAALYRV